MGIRNFYCLFLPIMLFLMTTSTASYIERVFLFQYSEHVLAGVLNGFFLIRIFQASTLCVTIGGQGYIALFYGAKQFKEMGPCIWQLIWFSLLTILIIPPLGFGLHYLFYSQGQLMTAETAYFSLLCWFNFLVPLIGSLSAFYIGQKKVLLVVGLTIGSACLNLILDYYLIFGSSFFPPLGSLGAAISKVISQIALCGTLFALFLRDDNHKQFGSRCWKWNKELFYQYVKPGFLRGLGTIPCLSDWFLVSKTMTFLSDQHLHVFTIGSTLFYFFAFFSDALFQTTLTASSYHLGKNEPIKVWNVILNATFSLGCFTALLGLFFFFCPKYLIYFFQNSMTAQAIAPGVWIALMGYGFNLIALGVITAACDTWFLLKYYCLFWMISFIPIYFLMGVFGLNVHKFWFLVFISNLVTALIFFKRVSQKRWASAKLSPVPAVR
ncbi:MAG: MATE family efflux transporter [Candidatus Rhabdochlamydia sp.]